MKTTHRATRLVYLVLLCVFAASAHSASSLEQLVDEHGKERVVAFLLSNGDGKLFISSKSGIRSARRPSAKFVTLSTMRMDIDRFGFTVEEIDLRIKAENRQTEQPAEELDTRREQARKEGANQVSRQDMALAAEVTYTVVDEEIYDAPIKTQIAQDIVVSGVPTKANLEAEMLKRYRVAKARHGFRYHNPANAIYIRVYGTKQYSHGRKGSWIGMVAMQPSDKGEPSVLVDDKRLAALSQVPKERFGLSERERMQVFWEITVAEARARRETEPMITVIGLTSSQYNPSLPPEPTQITLTC